MRGVAHISKGFICVGSSVGNVLVLSAPSPNGENIELQHNLDISKTPITAIAASDNHLVCGNESGEVFCFSVLDAFEILCKFPGDQFPCTSLCTRDDTIIASYTTGHIRIFRASISELAIEVTAHSRSITAMAIDPYLNIIASVSEDQFLHVWQFPTFNSRDNCDMDLIYSDKIENKLLTGVTFLSGIDSRIAVVSYDDDELIIYEKS